MPSGVQGESESINQQRSNVRRIFNEHFRDWAPVRGKYRVPFDQLAESVVCSEQLYEDFSAYLVNEDGTGYVQSTGQYNGHKLSLGSVEDYLGCLLNLAAARFKATGDLKTKMFFTCLDAKSTTDQARWLQKLKAHKIVRILFQRAMESGEVMDKSVPPIFLQEVRRLCEALLREGSDEVRAPSRAIPTPHCQPPSPAPHAAGPSSLRPGCRPAHLRTARLQPAPPSMFAGG